MQGSSDVDIDVPIEHVWMAVIDPGAMLEWQPDLKSLECLEWDEHDRPVLVHAVLDTIVRTAEVTLRMRYDEPYTMHWEKESGDVPGFVGSWTLIELDPGRTRVEYRLTIDFGRLGRLVRGPFSDKLIGGAVSSMPLKLKTYVERVAQAA